MQLDQIGSIDQYKYWNEKSVTYWLIYDYEINRKFINITNTLLSNINIKKNSKILDIGCGSGNISKIISEKVGKKGEVLGIDISKPMLKLFNKNTKNIKNTRNMQIDIEKYSFEEKLFNYAVSRFGVMFFENPCLAFKNIYTSLKKGGFLTFVCWTDFSYNEFFSLPALAVTKVTGIKRPSITSKPGPFAFSNNNLLYKILKKNNYKNINIKTVKTLLPADDIDIDVEILTNIGTGAKMIREKKLRKPEITKVKRELNKLLYENIYKNKKKYKAKIFLVSAKK